MVNSDEFSKRLQQVIDYYGETASSFSDIIGVQRSSISHILSGRNKPSLDFVLKILAAYPEVELYWLLNGRGEFPSQPQKVVRDIKQNSEVPKIAGQVKMETSDKSIDKIVIFYNDGTFKEFVEK